MNKAYKKQLVLYFIDISKLIFGGSVIVTVINIQNFDKNNLVVASICSTIIFAIIGFTILKK